MKITNKDALVNYIAEESNRGYYPYQLLRTLIDYFEYSIKDIKSYEGLSDEVKQIIPEFEFESLIAGGQ